MELRRIFIWARKKYIYFPYYIFKDFIGFVILFFVLLILITLNPFILGVPDNFIPANPLNTPIHI